jgi:hypothetical protein
MIGAAEWAKRSDSDMRRAYTIGSLVQSGPFLTVRLGWSERLPPSSGMQGHSGNTTFWLMRLGNEWVVVMAQTVAS